MFACRKYFLCRSARKPTLLSVVTTMQSTAWGGESQTSASVRYVSTSSLARPLSARTPSLKVALAPAPAAKIPGSTRAWCEPRKLLQGCVESVTFEGMDHEAKSVHGRADQRDPSGAGG